MPFFHTSFFQSFLPTPPLSTPQNLPSFLIPCQGCTLNPVKLMEMMYDLFLSDGWVNGKLLQKVHLPMSLPISSCVSFVTYVCVSSTFQLLFSYAKVFLLSPSLSLRQIPTRDSLWVLFFFKGIANGNGGEESVDKKHRIFFYLFLIKSYGGKIRNENNLDKVYTFTLSVRTRCVWVCARGERIDVFAVIFNRQLTSYMKKTHCSFILPCSCPYL